jgi:hypothetical protein
MSTYLFTFRALDGHAPPADTFDRWAGWQLQLGGRLRDRGNVAFRASVIGNCGPDANLGGYSLVRATSLEEAVALAQDCPILLDGSGVEIGELTNLDDQFDEWLTAQSRRNLKPGGDRRPSHLAMNTGALSRPPALCQARDEDRCQRSAPVEDRASLRDPGRRVGGTAAMPTPRSLARDEQHERLPLVGASVRSPTAAEELLCVVDAGDLLSRRDANFARTSDLLRAASRRPSSLLVADYGSRDSWADPVTPRISPRQDISREFP